MFDKCKNCAHSGKDCIPHLMALAASDLLAWCKARKKLLDLSNAEIAERSDVPKGTIDRLFGKEEFTEFRFTTIQPVIRVLTGCKLEDLDCADPVCADQKLIDTIEHQKERIETLEKEKKHLLKQEERYIKEFESTKAENRANIAALTQLCKTRLKAIKVLSISLAACLLLIIAALIFDKINPYAGFFWRNFTAFFTNIQRGLTL